MDEKDNSRSSLQTAADLGRAAKAAYRIAQAAAVSGVHGAAAAAVKETVPALVKFLLVVLLIMIVIPMVVFTALPNIFFGYDSSDTASVIHMTEQAMRIGGAYMSLDDFERTQIDSIVTGIAAEYEADGTAIDHIEVKNTMKEDDLLWIIAINSAAYEQDLDAMSAELIQNFCQSTLSYQPSLSLLGGSTSATLEVEIKRIDPEELMEQMGFNEDARQWAGALFETLKDSGALEKYGGYFSAYQPDYSGDGSYSGDIQHGTSYDNDIDISRFVSPSTKNNLDLAAYAVQAWENNWGYAEQEENEACREMIEDNIREIGHGIAGGAMRHRFFLVFQYEPSMRAKRNTVQAIIQRLNEEADTARRYLDLCELEVLEPQYSDNFVLKLLYEILNKKTSQRVRLPEGVFDMTTAVHGIYEE